MRCFQRTVKGTASTPLMRLGKHLISEECPFMLWNRLFILPMLFLRTVNAHNEKGNNMIGEFTSDFSQEFKLIMAARIQNWSLT
jgi:hypothetical protein